MWAGDGREPIATDGMSERPASPNGYHPLILGSSAAGPPTPSLEGEGPHRSQWKGPKEGVPDSTLPSGDPGHRLGLFSSPMWVDHPACPIARPSQGSDRLIGWHSDMQSRSG